MTVTLLCLWIAGADLACVPVATPADCIRIEAALDRRLAEPAGCTEAELDWINAAPLPPQRPVREEKE